MSLIINSKDITFVVQGPIVIKDNQTRHCLLSVRKYYPKSKIILSTWKGSQIDNLDYDEVILSDDPGAKHIYFKNYINNLNRMIISTKSGILKSNTKYTVKIRTDIIVKNSNLLHLLVNIKKPQNGLFDSRIIIPSNWSKNPDRHEKMLFHPSDFLYAGLTKDLKDLFSIPLMSEDDMTWFKKNKIPSNAAIPSFIPRYANEQYIMIAYLNKKNFNHGLNHVFDYSKKAHETHNKFFFQNLLLKHAKNIGVNSQKYPYKWSTNCNEAYTELEVLNLGNKIKKIDCERMYYNFLTIFKFILKFLERITIGFTKKKILRLNKTK